jgi:hypothetical protein
MTRGDFQKTREKNGEDDILYMKNPNRKSPFVV